MAGSGPDPDNGASSIESRGSEPLCSFDPETGFTLNPITVDELRWYPYLDDPEPISQDGRDLAEPCEE